MALLNVFGVASRSLLKSLLLLSFECSVKKYKIKRYDVLIATVTAAIIARFTLREIKG